jgi:hypothetical protein
LTNRVCVPLDVVESEVVGDRAAEGGDGPLVSVGTATEEREENFVERGNRHGYLE